MTAPVSTPLTDAERATVKRADDALEALAAVVRRSAETARRLLADPTINPMNTKADNP